MSSLDEDYNKKIEERNNFKPEYITVNLFQLDKCEKTEPHTTKPHTPNDITSNEKDKFYAIQSSNLRLYLGPSRTMSDEEYNEIVTRFNKINPKDWVCPKLPDNLYKYYKKISNNIIDEDRKPIPAVSNS